ncbi:Peptide methionine sulfoxide reductase A5 [Linum perenne]
MAFPERNEPLHRLLLSILLLAISISNHASGIRLPERISTKAVELPDQPLKSAVFALGSFWRSEAVFGCLHGVVRTTVGYSGGSKAFPEYRSLADHAECVQVEYDPRMINYRQLLDVFWSSHDSRSIIFTNGTEESKIASVSKEKEQLKSRSSIVTTQIQQLATFYPAEPEHQKFELKRNPLLLQLMGNLPEEELERSSLAAKLNGFAAELCPAKIQGQINARINEIVKKGWPVLKNI